MWFATLFWADSLFGLEWLLGLDLLIYEIYKTQNDSYFLKYFLFKNISKSYFLIFKIYFLTSTHQNNMKTSKKKKQMFQMNKQVHSLLLLLLLLLEDRYRVSLVILIQWDLWWAGKSELFVRHGSSWASSSLDKNTRRCLCLEK